MNAKAAAGLDARRLRPLGGGPPMGIISWIILGLIAGIVGALVGGFLFDLFGAVGVTGLNLWSMLVAIAGSIVVLLIYNALMGRRRA
jgi:uncharacterized membrane protein YeaQ/YmgE (transglycosylase-associated protein family)